MHEEEGTADFYFNEEGLMVLAASYLRKRGYCCGNGCRHCPYEYIAVPEPEKSILLMQRVADDRDTNHSSSDSKNNKKHDG